MFPNSPIQILEAHRRFIFEGFLCKQNRRGELKKKKFFLCSDVLIYGREDSNIPVNLAIRTYTTETTGNSLNMKFSGWIELSALNIEDVEDVEIHPEVVVYRPQFGIFLSAPRKSFTVYAENKAEKQNWLELLTSTIKKAQEQKSRNISGSGLNSSSNEAKIQESPYKFAAGWVPDYVMRACPLCYTEFGFFFAETSL